MPYRHLTDSEISQLEGQGCTSEDWRRIRVAESFTPNPIHRAHFGGDVSIGRQDGSFEWIAGIRRPFGLTDCTIYHSAISDNVFISNVRLIANYRIEENTVIENVNSLVVKGETTFGNGTTIDVLNEAGGRTLKIFDRLSAQTAYILVFYRHNSGWIRKMEGLIDQYVETKKSTKGILGRGCRILNTREIINVEVGPYTTISGALRLEEGTIGSCPEDPAFIGTGVIAKKFIILSGSKIDESAILSSCFVGQSVKMGKQYSAENSAFFANSELFHGEGCSVFAGPYTVTHHKSSLLIAGCYSFYNAGSGTNQSNHMYKLGPVHQGILERGSKTGSFCYMMWPCRVGPFTNIIGKHTANFDTSDLPFSFINEEKGRSNCVPAMNLFTVGTRRDSVKWPARDRRKDPEKLDLIRFGLFTPYTVGKMVNAVEQLKVLYDQTPKTQETVQFNGISIDRLMIRTCLKYYEMAIKIFIGDVLIGRLGECRTFKEIRKKMDEAGPGGLSKWIDVFGLIISQESVRQVLDQLEKGTIRNIFDFQENLKVSDQKYHAEEWKWCVHLIEKRMNHPICDLTVDEFKAFVRDWKDNSVKLNNMILQDAAKEFDPTSSIGFGMDGGETERAADFKAVRGTLEENSFILDLKKDTLRIEETTEKVMKRLETMN